MRSPSTANTKPNSIITTIVVAIGSTNWRSRNTFTETKTRIWMGHPMLHPSGTKSNQSMLGTILIVLLVLMLLGALPTWGHSRSWGYGPSGGFGVVLLVLVVLVLTGRL